MMLERSLPKRVYLFFALVGLPCVSLLGTERVTLYRSSSIEFASVARGRLILTADDRFFRALSRFDLQSRLQTDKQVARRDLASFAAEQARDWSTDEIAKLSEIVTTISGQFAGYELPFPPTVVLIKTTGQEEGNAAYCRQNAIVLPQRFVDLPAKRLQSTLIHELFHILSSANPQWRNALYELVGFRPGAAIELPDSLRDRKITNPDAPGLDTFIELALNDEKVRALPVLYSETDYDPARGGSFFNYLIFRLMVLSQESDAWRAATRDGKPVLLAAEDTPDYLRQIGRNTKTIFHPEEILANNFTHLIEGTLGLPSPELIEQLRKRLTK